MQIVEAVALISINETLIFQMISFLIFLWIFNRVMIQPLRSVVKDRGQYIQGIQTGVADSQEQVEGLFYKITAQEQETRQAAQAIRGELEDAGNREASEVLHATREKVARIRQQAQQSLLQCIVDERQSVEAESESLCNSILEKILSRRVTS
ncbi:MAG: hypothetical protein WBG37_04560 [Desulfobacterales bacterium]